MLNIACDRSASSREVIKKGGCCEIVASEVQAIVKRYIFRESTEVLRGSHNIDDWAIKGTHSEVSSMIIEFAFTKICFALGIGPKVGSPSHDFDLICFDDCIEFCVEKCGNPSEGYSLKRVESRLKYCVRVMHLLQLIHKDIKPANILFSPAVNDFVLIDFVISCPVAEEQGFQTKSYREGTSSYMSPDMLKIKKGSSEFVDLYYNDQWAVCISINKLETEFNQLAVSASVVATDKDYTSAIASVSKTYRGQSHGENMKDNKFLLPSFPELQSQVPDIPGNIEFLIRSVGISKELLHYIGSCPMSPRI